MIFPRHFKHFGAEETYRWSTGLYTGLTAKELRTYATDMLNTETELPMHSEEISESANSGGELAHQGKKQRGKPLSITRGIRIRPAIRDLITWLGQLGVETHIISASNHWTVEVAARWTGVPPERIRGNRSQREEGQLTTRAETPITWGPGKATIASTLSAQPPILAIGDSRTDKELLSAADHAILVNRGDEKLAAFGESQGWAITQEERFSTSPYEFTAEP